jgi:hypothetical protein
MKLLRHFTANEEQLENFPFRRELSMESYLVENEGVLALDNDAFSDVSIIQEELTLKQGRSSKDTDGRIDILLTYSNEYIGVVELKLGELNNLHLEQLEDYLKEKHQIIEEFPNILDSSISPKPKWVGVLVGSNISPTLAQTLYQGYITKCGVQIAALTIQRFKGKNGSIYITTDIHFKNSLAAKDLTKYSFNGVLYGKGRLVLAVLKQHVSSNPYITFAELENNFPSKIQGSLGVFCSENEANNIVSKTARLRHFVKPNELIKIGDETIAVCSQWGAGNINNFISHAKKLGYSVNS